MSITIRDLIQNGISLGSSNYKRTRSEYSWSRLWPAGGQDTYGYASYPGVSVKFTKKMNVSYSKKYDSGGGKTAWSQGKYSKNDNIENFFYIGCNKISSSDKYKKGTKAASSENVSKTLYVNTNISAYVTSGPTYVMLGYTATVKRTSSSASIYYVDKTAITACPWFKFSLKDRIVDPETHEYRDVTEEDVQNAGAHIIIKLPSKNTTSSISVYRLLNTPSNTVAPLYDVSEGYVVTKNTTKNKETIDFNVTKLVKTFVNDSRFKGLIMICDPDRNSPTQPPTGTSETNNKVTLSSSGINVMGFDGTEIGEIFQTDIWIRVGNTWIKPDYISYKTGGDFKKLLSFLTRNTINGKSNWG